LSLHFRDFHWDRSAGPSPHYRGGNSVGQLYLQRCSFT
jgi:hypothetical protein